MMNFNFGGGVAGELMIRLLNLQNYAAPAPQ
jgi:hypothetical protein